TARDCVAVGRRRADRRRRVRLRHAPAARAGAPCLLAAGEDARGGESRAQLRNDVLPRRRNGGRRALSQSRRPPVRSEAPESEPPHRRGVRATLTRPGPTRRAPPPPLPRARAAARG